MVGLDLTRMNLAVADLFFVRFGQAEAGWMGRWSLLSILGIRGRQGDPSIVILGQ